MTDSGYIASNISSQISSTIAGVDIPLWVLTAPSGFNMTIPFDITYTGPSFVTDIDSNDYKVTPTTNYYVSTTGSSGNDGLTVGTPKASVNQVITLGNASGNPYQVNVAVGTYDRNATWDISPTQPCNVIGASGTIISSQQGLTFTADVGSSYKATRSAVGVTFDADNLDANGDYGTLVLVADAATCGSTAGSWYTDNVDVWVHTIDSRDLAADSSSMRIYLYTNPPTLATNNDLYIENIDFQGFGNASFAATNASGSDTAVLYGKNCSFKYTMESSGGAGGNAFSANGIFLVILDNCIAAKAYLDGFNYHAKNGIVPKSIEINCIGRTNGFSISSPDSNNGSTTHDGGQILRINGAYHGNQGRNLHDASAATESWNVGCNAYGSQSLTSTGGVNWASGDGSNTKLWLTSCLSSNSVNDYYVNTNGEMYINEGSPLIYSTGVNNGIFTTFVQL